MPFSGAEVLSLMCRNSRSFTSGCFIDVVRRCLSVFFEFGSVCSLASLSCGINPKVIIHETDLVAEIRVMHVEIYNWLQGGRLSFRGRCGTPSGGAKLILRERLS